MLSAGYWTHHGEFEKGAEYAWQIKYVFSCGLHYATYVHTDAEVETLENALLDIIIMCALLCVFAIVIVVTVFSVYSLVYINSLVLSYCMAWFLNVWFVWINKVITS